MCVWEVFICIYILRRWDLFDFFLGTCFFFSLILFVMSVNMGSICSLRVGEDLPKTIQQFYNTRYRTDQQH